MTAGPAAHAKHRALSRSAWSQPVLAKPALQLRSAKGDISTLKIARTALVLPGGANDRVVIAGTCPDAQSNTQGSIRTP